MRIFITITTIALLVSCNRPKDAKPIWLNKSDTVSMPSGAIALKSTVSNWQCALLSFSQPLPLQTKYHKGVLTVKLKHTAGVTEGPAQLTIQNKTAFYYFDVYLKNDTTGKVSSFDYRSPKTVNPDSSLLQQRIIHLIDEWRNIVALSPRSYFFEEDVKLSPASGVFFAQKQKPISAFYVQAGSVVKIPLKSSYLKNEEVFLVKAGPMYDEHNNQVADGTSIVFYYTTTANKQYRMEGVLLNGFCTVKIPYRHDGSYLLYAQIHKTHSNKIQLLAK